MSRLNQSNTRQSDEGIACEDAKMNNLKKIEQLKSLACQVSGHRRQKQDSSLEPSLGMCDLENGMVLKPVQPPPRGLRELKFYKEVFSPHCVDQDLLDLQHFLPTFYGTEEIEDRLFLKLSNLTADSKRPCIADLKMGRISYDQEATEEKKKAEETKYPPAKELGFHFTGMMIYEDDKPFKISKPFCRSLTKDSIVSKGFGSFFNCIPVCHQRQTIQHLISRLKRIELWFSKQKKYSFIASSLLIVYEALSTNLCNKLNEETAQQYNVNTAPATLSDHTSGTGSQPPHSELLPSSHQGKSIPAPQIQQPSHVKRSLYNKECDPERPKRRKSDIINNTDNELHHSNKVTNSSLQCNDKAPAITVHLIDFAHTFPTTDIDHNVLFGVRKLISCLQVFIEGK